MIARKLAWILYELIFAQVSSSDNSLVSIDAPTSEAHTDSVIQYQVTLKLSPLLWDRGQLEASIEIKSITTGQNQLIPVRIQLIGRKDDPQNGEDLWKYSATVTNACILVSLSSGRFCEFWIFNQHFTHDCMKIQQIPEIDFWP